jgi:5-methylcytosine-specific restriction endonuclease McrA
MLRIIKVMSFDNKQYQKKYYAQVKASKTKKSPKVVLSHSDKEFTTVDSFKKYTSELIRQHMDVIISEDHIIYNYCIDLYERHPEFDGFHPSQFMFVSHEKKYKSPSLSIDLYRGETYRPHYRGEDKLWHTFSITKCITGKDQSYKQRLLAAMRNEVNNDILEHRRKQPYCVRCKCSDMSKLEVDHTGKKEFSEIAQMFIDILDGTGDFKGLTIPKKLEFYKEGVKYLFKDRNEAFTWIELHKDQALLQTLCKDCHKVKTH